MIGTGTFYDNRCQVCGRQDLMYPDLLCRECGRVAQQSVDGGVVERLRAGYGVATATRAERIEAARLLAGQRFTVAQIANRMHCTERTIQKYLSGAAAK